MVLSSYETGLLFEAYARGKMGLPLSDKESTVTYLGNSGLTRKKLVREGYLREDVGEKGETIFLVTPRGLHAILSLLADDVAERLRD